MIILGLDPGVKNFAWAVFDTDKEEITRMGYLEPAESANDVPSFARKFKDFLEEISPRYVVVERYMFRGRQSIHAERNNLMISAVVLSAEMLHIGSYLVTPSAWKNWLKGAKAEKAREIVAPIVEKSKHEYDAAAMTCYFFYRAITFEGKKLFRDNIKKATTAKIELDHRWSKILKDYMRLNEKKPQSKGATPSIVEITASYQF